MDKTRCDFAGRSQPIQGTVCTHNECQTHVHGIRSKYARCIPTARSIHFRFVARHSIWCITVREDNRRHHDEKSRGRDDQPDRGVQIKQMTIMKATIPSVQYDGCDG